jgi:hypothetical protein
LEGGWVDGLVFVPVEGDLAIGVDVTAALAFLAGHGHEA